MRKLNELFRLKFEHGLSNRKVALACNTHHSVVSDYLVRFKLARLKWPLEPEISEEYLYQKLFPEKQALEISSSRPIPDWEKVYEELKSHKYLTLQLIQKKKGDRRQMFHYQSPFNTKDTFTAKFKYIKRKTIFIHFGYLFPYFCIIFVLIYFVIQKKITKTNFLSLKKRNKKNS